MLQLRFYATHLVRVHDVFARAPCDIRFSALPFELLYQSCLSLGRIWDYSGYDFYGSGFFWILIGYCCDVCNFHLCLVGETNCPVLFLQQRLSYLIFDRVSRDGYLCVDGGFSLTGGTFFSRENVCCLSLIGPFVG